MSAESPDDVSAPRPAHWFLLGVRGVLCVPAFILLTSIVGFGVLCREAGLSIGQAMLMTASIWALPSQVVLVGAIASGASLAVASLAVALSAVRLTPMTAAWVPLVRGSRTPLWRILLLSHFVAVTAWVWAFLRLPELPRDARLSVFAGFTLTLTSLGVAVTAASFAATPALPPILAAALFFLTPIYFITSLWRASQLASERLALAIGLVLGPLFFALEVPLDLLWAGLVAGTLAWGAERVLSRRSQDRG